jgi:hypothetical protein
MTRVRLAAFAGIGVLAALQWSTLLVDPPTARLLGVVAIATLLGAALTRLRGLPAARRRLAAAGLVIGATIAALLVLGVPARTLPPWHWERLGSGIDLGLTGLGGKFDYPFTGPGEWARLLLVGAIVPLTIASAFLSFLSRRDPDRVPVAGLVLLVTAFAIPAAARPTAAPLLWGAGLLLLVAAWLWGERARALPALAVVAGFGLAAIPVATSLASEDPPVDYRSWTLPGAERGTTFDWEPDYGPIDWPRTGELLFRVQADRPSYWRTAVLDEFYGDGWRRSGAGGPAVPAEPRPGQVAPGATGSVRSARFSMLDIESPLLISPGTPLAVKGVDGSDRDGDGTTHLDDDPLKAGASYEVTAWAPDPHPPALRAASRRYPLSLSPYTQLALPARADLESVLAPVHLGIPPWGRSAGRAEARRELDATAYAQVAHLAERLTAGERDAYDAATAVQDFLRTSYAYDEKPPERRLPLRAFLFQDKRGYCQQFSGAMALMLRMVGIPARVATGFAPGTPLANGRGFEVTDLEAHSWVEVYFTGVGWLPFDPTPPTTPASLEIRGGASFGIGASEFGGKGGKGGTDRSRNADGPDPAAAAEGGEDGSPISPLGLLAVLSGAVLVVPPIRSLRHRRLPSPVAADREAAELRRVLRRTGWSSGSSTLLIVEGRLRGARHQAAATYVRRFRDRLYGAGDPPAPTLADRRRLRRDLAAGGGLTARLRLLALIPPGAPLRPRRGTGTRRSR